MEEIKLIALEETNAVIAIEIKLFIIIAIS